MKGGRGSKEKLPRFYMIRLREYQEKFINDVRDQFRLGHHRVCGVAPCGAGKTVLSAWMIREAAASGQHAVFMVHRKELIEQTSGTFTAMDIPHGVIAGGVKPDYGMPVQVASVQTLARRLDKITSPNFIICDECHHIMAGMYQHIVDTWPDAWLLGVTATPQRTDGKGLGGIFDAMILGPSVRDLIAWGNLSKFQCFAPATRIDRKKFHVRFGEYVKSDVMSAMDKACIYGDIIADYKRLIPGCRAICYCISREYSEKQAAEFKAAGISAAYVDCETPKEERRRIIDGFRNGEIKVLCNVDLFGEGFDVPAMDGVILARPTASLILHIQQVMRCMRPDPNNPDKKAVIIDSVGNTLMHGLPTDDFHWSLDGEQKANRKQKKQLNIKTCPKCFLVLPATAKTCPGCGHKFRGEGRQIEENHRVGLVDYKQAMQFASPMQKKRRADADAHYAKNYTDMLKIAKYYGYKPGWAYHKAKELGVFRR